MGARRGREMRRHIGGRQLLLPAWLPAELGSEELSRWLCSPISRSMPPRHRLGKELTFILANLAPYGSAVFLPHLQSILRGDGGQQDLPGPPASQVLPEPLLSSQSCGGEKEQRKRSGHQLLISGNGGTGSSGTPAQRQAAVGG